MSDAPTVDAPDTVEDALTGTWDADRLARARVELDQIAARLKDEAAAKQSDDDKRAEFDKAVSRRGGREFVRKTCGFDPGWPE